MKSEKGITLTSIIIYVVAMIVVVGIVAVITRYYYGNVNKLSNNTASMEEVTKLNTFLTEEVNKSGNIIYDCNTQNNGKNDNYIIFYNQNDKDEKIGNLGYTQYTFKNKFAAIFSFLVSLALSHKLKFVKLQLRSFLGWIW